ncbi:hypothetical protein EVA_07849 [gut metagenome]|uniref:Uncharacterized protein n=1 Tax=gut metagenome TaxID=749906 RepID=J9G9V2_9ZZZZ
MCIFSSTCFMSSIGHSEPAMIPVLSDVKSNMLNIGWLSSAINIVGTPYRAVQRSLWIDANTSSGSNFSTITCVHPWVSTFIDASTTPKQWNSGTQQHSLSSEVNLMCSPVIYPLLVILRWVSITPLGKPVVPDVYCIFTTSFGDTLALAISSVLLSTFCPSSNSSAVLYIPLYFSCPI